MPQGGPEDGCVRAVDHVRQRLRVGCGIDGGDGLLQGRAVEQCALRARHKTDDVGFPGGGHCRCQPERFAQGRQGGGQQEIDTGLRQHRGLPGVELMRIGGCKGFGRIIGIPAAAQQTADDNLPGVPAIAAAQSIQKPEIVAVHVHPDQTGGRDPFAAGPPGGGGEKQRQVMPEADVQILPADGRKRLPFRRVVDKSGIDDMGVELAVRVAAQALDDRPLAQDAFGLL